MGGGSSKWLREPVPEHKFTYINIDEYRIADSWSTVLYCGEFIGAFRRLLTYCADIAATITINTMWKSLDDEVGKTSIFDFSVFSILRTYGAPIYLVSFFMSYIFLAFDINRAYRIVQSKDIAFAFTDDLTNSFYSLRSSGYWNFFRMVGAHFKTTDKMILFVFFRIKVWLRLLFAETPRQLVNLAMTNFLLYKIYQDALTAKHGETAAEGESASTRANAAAASVRFDIGTTFRYLTDKNTPQSPRLYLMLFVLFVYTLSVLKMIIAVALYVPLALRIRGNIKEYMCHKIDKRIGELLRQKAAHRIQNQRNELEMEIAAQRAQTPYYSLQGMPRGPHAEMPMLPLLP